MWKTILLLTAGTVVVVLVDVLLLGEHSWIFDFFVGFLWGYVCIKIAERKGWLDEIR
jgi:hypothetical protein